MNDNPCPLCGRWHTPFRCLPHYAPSSVPTSPALPTSTEDRVAALEKEVEALREQIAMHLTLYHPGVPYGS